MELSEVYPVLQLRIEAGPLQLAPVGDTDIPVLVGLAREGIHDPAVMPFAFPWTDAEPDRLPIEMARHYWRARADFSPEDWGMELVVRYDGEPVGVQALFSQHFLVTRSAETGSWLVGRRHGEGIGTAMRQAVCAFAFDHLGATEVTSAAFLDNPASRAVSAKVGYRSNGYETRKRREGESAVVERLVLTADDLVRGEPVQVTGLEGFRRFIGLPGTL